MSLHYSKHISQYLHNTVFAINIFLSQTSTFSMCCLRDNKNIDYLGLLACRDLAPNTNSHRTTQYNECHARLSISV